MSTPSAARDRPGRLDRQTAILPANCVRSHLKIGPPIVWGLVVDGEDGVREVLSLLRDELDLVMGLTGCRSIDEISFDLLRPQPRRCAKQLTLSRIR